MASPKKPDDVRMFPSLEMVPPKAPLLGSASGSRKGKRGFVTKKNITSVPKGSIESRQLPGLLSTTKPTINPSSNANDVSVLVGFNAANVQFDGELPNYTDEITMKAKEPSTRMASLATTDVGEYAADRMEEESGDAGESKPATEGGGESRMGTGRTGSLDGRSTAGSPKKQTQADAIVDELRNYTTLMDKFSLHNFVIYHGETLKNTPEFQSFRRQYTHEWGAISHLIAKLEKLCNEFHVKLAIINGPVLYDLASLNLPMVSKEQILTCISNIDQIKPQLKSSVSNADDGEEVTSEQQFRAVVVVQSLMRKFLSARRVRKIKLRLMGCIRIQAHLRKVVYRKFGLDRLKNAKAEQDAVWKASQDTLAQRWKDFEDFLMDSGARGMPPGKSVSFGSPRRSRKNRGDGNSSVGSMDRDNRRLIIHVPSISADEYTRLNMEGYTALQNARISALYQLIDPDVHLIYVTPVAIGAAEQAYHDKFLSMLGISTLPKRLHFVYPEMIQQLPQHLSLAQVLWCSSSALRKIKMQIMKIRAAVIVSGSVSWLDKRLGNLLKVPVLSSEPVVSESVKSRSYAKKIFMEANVNIPIGAHDIFTPEDLYIALSRLIASNLDINRWLIRLNFDYNGESTLILDGKKMEIVHILRSEQTTLFEQNYGNTGAWYSRPVQLSVRKRIVAELKSSFTKIVKLCRPDAYKDIDAFTAQMRHVGAVVEAEPLEKLGWVDSMCYVRPDGECVLFTSADVIHDDKYQIQTYIAPTTLIPKSSLEGASKAVCNNLFKKWRVHGYVTLSFCSFWDGLDGIPRLSANGIQFGMTPQFGAFGTAGVATNPLPFAPLEYLPVYPPNFDPVEVDGYASSEKHCLYIPCMHHTPLKGTRDDVFLKFCQMRGITFDKLEKTGTLFFMVDSVMSGALSMMIVGNSRYRVMEEAVNNMTFICQQFGKDANCNGYYDQLTVVNQVMRKAFKKEEAMHT